jgi:molybdopterin-guanine dinucleotide biosynthesis protein A
MNLTGIILAGGKSSRLGFDKCKIKFDEYTIVESLILKLKQICDEIIISENSNSFHNENCYSQHDEIEDIGPIGGIYSSINKSKNFKNIIVSCDTPFLNIQYLNFMYEQSLRHNIFCFRK